MQRRKDAMTSYAQDREVESEWVVIAQAEGILSARHRLPIADATAVLRDDAHARGVPILRLAEDLVYDADRTWWGAAADPERSPVGLDLDEEQALHDGIRRRRPAPVVLDAETETLLRELLS